MTDFDWRGALRTVAPTVATMLGGPLAGMAATVAGRVLLGRSESEATSVQEAEAAIAAAAATPEGLVKLRELQVKLEEARLTAQVRLEEVAAGDRKDARALAVATGDWTPKVLGLLTVGAFFGYAVWATSLDPTSQTIYLVLGWLGGMATAVMTYHFGSSAGSKHKQEAQEALAARLVEMARPAAAAAAPLLPMGQPAAPAASSPLPTPSPPGLTADELNARELDRHRPGM